MLKSIKKMFGGTDENQLKSAPVSLDDYVEVPVKVHDDSNIVKIKVCELDDYRDATDIAVMVEAGYIVIANTIDLDREMDEEYAKLLKYLKDKLLDSNGTIIRLCDNKIMAIPNNVIIEKLVKEPETEKSEPEPTSNE
nr:cell division protein SepF [Methanothermococcus okinawensis]